MSSWQERVETVKKNQEQSTIKSTTETNNTRGNPYEKLINETLEKFPIYESLNDIRTDVFQEGTIEEYDGDSPNYPGPSISGFYYRLNRKDLKKYKTYKAISLASNPFTYYHAEIEEGPSSYIPGTSGGQAKFRGATYIPGEKKLTGRFKPLSGKTNLDIWICHAEDYSSSGPQILLTYFYPEGAQYGRNLDLWRSSIIVGSNRIPIEGHRTVIGPKLISVKSSIETFNASIVDFVESLQRFNELPKQIKMNQ